MKKNLLLAIAFIAFINFSQAQAVLNIIQADSNKVLNGDTVVITGVVSNSNTAEMSINLWIVNTSTFSSVSVGAKRDSLKLPLPFYWDNQICWGGSCWDTNYPNSSVPPETIGHGDTSNTLSTPEFNGHYFPFGHYTPAFLRYTFFNTNIPTDSSWVVVEYFPIPTGIKNISGQMISFSAYPNPANSFINFNYILNGAQRASLKIFNLLGECVQTLPLNVSKNKTSIDVQSIPSGVYVCEIEADGSMPTYQRLVVSH